MDAVERSGGLLGALGKPLDVTLLLGAVEPVAQTPEALEPPRPPPASPARPRPARPAAEPVEAVTAASAAELEEIALQHQRTMAMAEQTRSNIATLE